MNLKNGAFLHNNTYRIERVLGQGGFGITYLATDVRYNYKVAIKEFFPKSLCDRDANTSQVFATTDSNVQIVEKLRKKFLKEAEHISKMNSLNIVRMFDVFEDNGTAYYVMEYIEGMSLSDMVKRNGPLAEDKAVGYILQIGEALTYIHSKRINHLDVKPANIMIRTVDNTAVLVDFGLSKQYDSDGQQTSTTPIGISHGYAPMEQYNDGGVKEFSPQTDLYSLAATLYYLVSGIVPPHASKMIDEELSFPKNSPAALIAPIHKAMSPKRAERQGSVEAFCNQIRVGHNDAEETQFEPQKESPDEVSSQKDSSDKKFLETDESYAHRKYLESLTKDERKTIVRHNLKKFIIYAFICIVLVGFLVWLDSKSENNDEGNRQDDLVAYNVDGNISGHDYVDLGLPSGTLWATDNINETSDDNSMYFEWRDTEPKNTLYISVDTIVAVEHYLKGICGTKEDVASVLWGNEWMLPSEEDFKELEQYCTAVWNNSKKGLLLTGPNGKSIFFSANGFMSNSERDIEDNGHVGYYMIGKRSTPPPIKEEGMVYHIANPDDLEVRVVNITDGLSVRPVAKKLK